MKPLTPIALLSNVKEMSYDESGSQVVKVRGFPSQLPLYDPRQFPDPAYKTITHGFTKVPPLAFFCIQKLLQRHLGIERGAILDTNWIRPVPYLPPQDPEEPDLLQLLIPHMHRQSRAVQWRHVDPRLWVTIIQSFWPKTLPSTFFTYPIPLADPYLPYLQYLEPTDQFSFTTILNLSRRKELSDQTILVLRGLHQLAVLEIGLTNVTTMGVKKLADCLEVNDARGPWRLRMLGLKGCAVDDEVAPSLRLFPLLSVVDLRDSKCSGRPHVVGWADILEAEEHPDVFEPSPPAERLSALGRIAESHQRELFLGGVPPFVAYVEQLFHPSPPTQRLVFGQSKPDAGAPRVFPEQNAFFVLGPDGSIGSGSTDVLERQRKAAEDSGTRLSKGFVPGRNNPAYHSEWKPGEWERFCQSAGIPLETTPAVERGSEDDEEKRLASLRAIRLRVYEESEAKKKAAEIAADHRRERERVERSRTSLSDKERLNRTLVLVRVPPPYSDLDAAIEKKRKEENRKAAIKKALEEPRSSTERKKEPVIVVNRKRGAVHWDEVKDHAGLPPAKASRSSSWAAEPAAMQRKPNPFSKKPSKDAKKVVRQD